MRIYLLRRKEVGGFKRNGGEGSERGQNQAESRCSNLDNLYLYHVL